MIEAIFALDEEETTPATPEEGGEKEGGDEGEGDSKTTETEARLDDEEGEKEEGGDKSDSTE